MKKVLIIMMAVLLIGALFISCSNEVEKDTLGKVSISFDDSRSINTSVTSSVKSVNELVWFYTATKTSGLYATGQTSSLTIVPAYDNNSTAGKLTTGTSLGNFSTGNWKFSFYGFNEAADSSDLTKAVYYSIDIPVRVEGEGQVAVRIVLSEGEVDLGKVVFDNLSIDLNAFNGLLRTGGTLSLDIFMNEETETGKVATMSGGPVTAAAVYNLTSAAEKTNLQAGTYEFIFVLNYTTDAGLETEETVEVARESKTVVIANGTIITFSGDILKTNTLKNVVIGDITEGENKAQASFVGEVPTEQTTVSVAVSPASASDTSETIANTKVTFPADMLATAVINAVEQNEVLTSSKVTIEVTSTLEATTKFEIKATSDSNAFAGINLDLWKTTTQENVETTAKIDNPTFTSPVTVETYIAKGLTGVTVEYQGDSELSHPVASNDQAKIEAQQADEYDTDAELGDKLGYSRDSGLLRFTTTHFSEFAVGADQNVYDKTSNTAYILSDLTANDMNSEHEYVLLDSRLANTVPDAIDNFNAGYKWSAVHPAGDNPNTEDFAGGYGTKIEPYLIGSLNQLVNMDAAPVRGDGINLYFALVADINANEHDSKVDWYHGTYEDDETYYHVTLRGHELTIGEKDLFDCAVKLEMCNGRIDYNGAGTVVSAACYQNVTDYEMYFHNLVLSGEIRNNSSPHYGPLVSYAYGINSGNGSSIVADDIINNLVIESNCSNGYVGGLFGYVQGSKVKASVTNCTFNGTINAPYAGGFLNPCSFPNLAQVESSGNTLNGSLRASSGVQAFGCNTNLSGGTTALNELNNSVTIGPDAVMTVLAPSTDLITVDANNEVILKKDDNAASYRVAVLFMVNYLVDGSGGYPRYITVDIPQFETETKETGVYKYAIIQESSDTSEGKTVVLNGSGVKVWIDEGAYHLFFTEPVQYEKSNNKATIIANGYSEANQSGEIVTHQEIPYTY